MLHEQGGGIFSLYFLFSLQQSITISINLPLAWIFPFNSSTNFSVFYQWFIAEIRNCIGYTFFHVANVIKVFQFCTWKRHSGQFEGNESTFIFHDASTCSVRDAQQRHALIPLILLRPLTNPSLVLPVSLIAFHPIEKFIWNGTLRRVGCAERSGSGPGVPRGRCSEKKKNILLFRLKGKDDDYATASAWTRSRVRARAGTSGML